MKNFIKKILDWFRKCWNRLVSLLYKIPADKKMHFWAGLFFATLFAIVFEEKFCFIAAFFAAVLKESFDAITTGEWDWKDAVATLVGGAIPQLFVLLNIWIH